MGYVWKNIGSNQKGLVQTKKVKMYTHARTIPNQVLLSLKCYLYKLHYF